MDRLFRTLRADEIDCRIGTIKENGLTLLLYKDARCDMNILDETFGPMNWQRHHGRENANCIVSIYDPDKAEWIEKEDTGTESNTEAEKGLASDSFKRACFNWGIGRELYTAPFIWIPADRCKIIDGRKCYDKFRVVEIGYTDTGAINKLVISNDSRGVDVFSFQNMKTQMETTKPKQGEGKQPIAAPDGFYYCTDCGSIIKTILLKDGGSLSSSEIAARTLGKYGRQLCKECSKNAKPLD